MRALEELQNNSRARLNDELYVPLGFSFGCCLTEDQTDYHALLSSRHAITASMPQNPHTGAFCHRLRK